MKQAVTVEEALIWVYSAQRADMIIDGGVGLHPTERKASGLQVMAMSGDIPHSYGALGTRIDGGGLAAIALHPDAEAIHRTLLRLPSAVAQVAIRYGKTELMPDCYVGREPKLMPRLRANGRPLMAYHPVSKQAMWCELDYSEVYRVLWGREQYIEWYAAMGEVADHLTGVELSSYVVTGLAAIPHPWQKQPLANQRELLDIASQWSTCA